MAETNPFVIAFGWPQLTVDARVPVLFDLCPLARLQSVLLNATKSLGPRSRNPGMPVHQCQIQKSEVLNRKVPLGANRVKVRLRHSRPLGFFSYEPGRLQCLQYASSSTTAAGINAFFVSDRPMNQKPKSPRRAQNYNQQRPNAQRHPRLLVFVPPVVTCRRTPDGNAHLPRWPSASRPREDTSGRPQSIDGICDPKGYRRKDSRQRSQSIRSL